VLLEGEESTLDPDVDRREELYQIPPDDPDAGSWFLDEGPDLLATDAPDAAARAALTELSRQLEDTLAARPFEY
jgi:hypothetical protein